MCSSGTTGLPKGVMITHTNVMVRYMHTIDPRYVTKSDNFLALLPQFHCYGLLSNFFALVEGQRLILMKKFDEEIFLQTIQNYQISSLFLVSPLIVLLAKSPLVGKYDLSCVKDIVGGAAPLSKETEEAVITRLKIPSIRQGYGLTEATLCVLMMNVGDSKPGSCGKVVSYVTCKVRDPETGKSLGPGKVGELCFKGPLLMPGYYKNEEATRNSFTSDGWLLTGDLGYYDQDEYFYIVDRLKELIKYKGFQVAPAELEAVILSHPKVQDVGVVGLPDESSGELPVAFVVKKPGAKLTEQEIINFVAGKVSSQKRLRGGVIFVPSIPKNPSGKILRRELRNTLINHWHLCAMVEDNTFIIKGLPPLAPIPDTPIGKLLYDQLLANCDNNPALIDAMSGQTLTYRELLDKTCTLAENLRKSGFGKTTNIAICCQNSVDFFTPIIAALYIGATVVPINHNYTETELGHALRVVKPQIIFCSELTRPKFAKLQQRFDFLIFLIENLPRNGLYRCCLEEVDVGDHVAFILFSSGTTGLPKGVMITHRNVLTRFAHADDPRLVLRKDGQSILGLLPFYHAYGLFVSLACIQKRVKIIVLQKFDENIYLQCIEKYKITSLTLVPPLAIFLAKSPLAAKYDLSSVQEVGCGAAPLSKNIEELLKRRLKISNITQAYGLTETTLAVMGVPTGETKPGSCGKLYPHLLCKIRDPESRKSLGPNQVGELCVKGPIVMKGYYRDEEATKGAFTSDGWLLTGDLGYYDHDGYFFITGRLKELIKYKGLQVPPAELEAILLTHPKIKDVGVIGIPDEEAGELPLAFIVRNEDDLTEDQVKSFLDGKVSPHKRLRGGVIFLEEIPKNPSGKILRRKLHELFHRYIRSKL
ncbi:Luciferin 4-monooxygenase-like Protein [Tribolium castaneum]|uniref:Luciferin 4-monooxygenase n=1 Tax=Tribolium castaneum TaxID=7070 RepID=D6WTG4_TRICA|nr:Luciferin 4-monooxygenase-like Protein [Tribolium castaneum]